MAVALLRNRVFYNSNINTHSKTKIRTINLPDLVHVLYQCTLNIGSKTFLLFINLNFLTFNGITHAMKIIKLLNPMSNIRL